MQNCLDAAFNCIDVTDNFEEPKIRCVDAISVVAVASAITDPSRHDGTCAKPVHECIESYSKVGSTL